MLSNKTALVTGSAQGIGFAIARELASLGANVVVADLNEPGAARAAQHIIDEGGNAAGQPLDVTSRSSVEDAFGQTRERFGPVDILVNNAGISIDAGLRKLTDQQWNATIAVSQTGVMLCSQAAARQMTADESRGGTIVNIASRAWLGWWGQTAYASAKGGVVSATRSMAIELARYDVRVNCIAPGLIDTPLLRAEPAHVMERLLQAQPLGTIGSDRDVAWATAYLAGPTSAGVTGQVLYVCGGKSLYARPAR
ncbi:SDR family NAD(P)-dependent oxidoreductase [Kribbella sp. NPDC050820]|uniref:SDR family NAD(P)-dependent oxidoreductase n=1 Tax=Kribbella sp. NPDC050820 TaxID=3155408 RepID=UPI0033E47A1F